MPRRGGEGVLRLKAAAVVVAGGSGSRMGRPKQFLPLAGRPVVGWAVEAFRAIEAVEDIVVVLGKDDLASRRGELEGPKVRFAEAGATRLGSVRAGFAALPPGAGIVAVHDGARPLIAPEVIEACLAAAAEHGASVPAARVKDTLKEAEPGEAFVGSTPDRARFWAAQTPQCYRRELLARALERFSGEEGATDESQLVERLGARVRLVESGSDNLKITTPDDLPAAEALLERRLGTRAPRTGFGYDIHRLVAGRPLKLGGVEIPHAKGLLGHSDGDVVLHAAADAILGALGEGEIGLAFPPEDPRWRGVDSRRILAEAAARAAARRARVVHLDLAIVAEEPKLKPHYAAILASVRAALGLPEKAVNLKAKSHEGLGPVGEGKAIACYAVATLEVPG